MGESIKLIECPRDAMQGINKFIPTKKKIRYIQSLLRVGFDTIDFGSFVSPRAIPQMQDTASVLSQLDLSGTNSKLLAIVANLRGAIAAANFSEIDYLGYPFSISENFQMRNTHKTILESVDVLKKIIEITKKKIRGWLSIYPWHLVTPMAMLGIYKLSVNGLKNFTTWELRLFL